MSRPKRDGGSFAPSPGLVPRGARKNERNPASSSIPSDWYDEKSCSALMQERKSTVQIAIVSRGQKLKTTRIDATRPATTTRVSARSDALIQSKVGAYQTPSIGPSCEESWCR